MAADYSDGTELYVVDGQSPRQLDRNITLVGRLVDGMELLTVLPRGTGPLGFYEAATQRVPIEALRMDSDVPQAELSKLHALRTHTHLLDAVVPPLRTPPDPTHTTHP